MINPLIVAAWISSLASVQALPQLEKRNLLTRLPSNAHSIEAKYQPAFDFDMDSCYQAAAIDMRGRLNPGRKLGGSVSEGCRGDAGLKYANTYSRQRCNNGYCGILYENYYEKDQSTNGVGEIAGGTNGHRHDWENVVVFVRMSDDTVVRVAVSQHNGYEARNSGFLLNGTHPLIVYHKDGGFTHCNRFANAEDMARPENVKKEFFMAPLVGWRGWPSNRLRESVTDYNWGLPKPKLGNDEFAHALERAGAAEVGLISDGYDDFWFFGQGDGFQGVATGGDILRAHKLDPP